MSGPARVKTSQSSAKVAIFLCVLALPFGAPAFGAIPTSERNALIDLYNSTNGAGWTTRTNWLGAAGTECTWHGVQCAGDTVTGLALGSNNLSGPIPASIQNLTNLMLLDLYGNAITGSIPSEIGNLSSLYNLMLGRNQLTGSIPAALGNLSPANMQYLYLYENQLTGTLPSSLQNLDSLRYLWVGFNDLSGSIPTWLANMPSLERLDLGANAFSGPIPPELGNRTTLTELELSGNGLTGGIPSSLGNLGNLTSLRIGNNSLTGSLPPTLGNLSALVTLELWGNDLSGEIPSELGNLASLQTLTLSDNRLSGAIPASLGNLGALQLLNLQRNDLAGQLPASLGNPSALQTLWLSGNAFTGPVPDSFASLAAVTNLSLSYNALHASGAAKSWADARQPGWESTQTVAPANVSVQSSTESTANLSWTPILYTTGTGRYEVYASAGGAPFLAGSTATKSSAGVTIGGLEAGTTYEITVRTVTEPIGFQNHNTVVSEASAAVTVTTASPSSPPLVVIESNPAPMFAEIGATSTTSLTLANAGGMETVVDLVRGDAFFEVLTARVTLGPGARATVPIRSTVQPVGAYSGVVMLSGAGVPDSLTTPVTLIVYGPPGADVPDVVPERVRIDVTGPGRMLPGSVSFRNEGSAAAVGVVVAESAWLIADRAPVEIPAGTAREFPFLVNRDFREDPSSTDSVTTTVRFVYPPVSSMKSAFTASSSGSQPGSTVHDTPPLAATTTGLPPVQAGQVGLAIPSIRSMPGTGVRFITDLVVGSSVLDTGLDLYLVPAGMPAQSGIRSGPLTTGPGSPLDLADVVGLGFQKPSSSGTLHFRSSASSSLTIDTMLQAIDDPRRLVAWRDVPAARSDRGAGPGESLYLPGVSAFLAHGGSLWAQEVAGSGVTYSVDLLDANGVVVGTRPSRQLGPFELATDTLPPSGSAATIAIRNVAGAGRISATCEEAGGELDAHTLWDASSAFGAWRSEELVIPWAASGGHSTICPENALCLLAGQFQLTLDARDQRTGHEAPGVPTPRNDLFGYFTLPGLTGTTEVPEVFVKVLDGRAYNGNYWTFFGGLTDLEYTLRVEDVNSGSTKTYTKAPGTSQGGFDTGSGVLSESCRIPYPFPVTRPPSTEPNSQLLLHGGRFRIELLATDPRTGAEGHGYAIAQNDVFGYFSIPTLTGNPANPEVFVKVLDGTAVNGRFWVFFGSLTDFGLQVFVTDTQTRMQRLYIRAGRSACGGYDTVSFTAGGQTRASRSTTGSRRETTSLAIFSPTGARVDLELRATSRTATASLDLAAGQTRVVGDVLGELFHGTSPESGAILLRPASGQISAAAWLSGELVDGVRFVASLPVLPTRLASGLGVERRFHGVADASDASILSGVATAVKPALAIVETAGSTAIVEIGVAWASASNLQGVRQTRNVTIAPRGFLSVDDVVRELLGARRDDAPDIWNATVWAKVVGGAGRIVPVLVSRSLSSGDRITRVR